jgi:DNA-binding NarL/FixJ family response regulator
MATPIRLLRARPVWECSRQTYNQPSAMTADSNARRTFRRSTDVPTPIRVLCVDDHRIVREGIASMLNREPDLTVAGAVATGEEALEFYKRHPPDVTLMDLQLRTMSGAETIQQIRVDHPSARIIVLTMYEGDEHIYRALKAGAVTYLLKDTLSKELIQAIRDVHAGMRPLTDHVQRSLRRRGEQPTLTAREIQVMELITEGRRNKEIAAILNISEDTVPVHLKNIFAKLKVNDRNAAMNVAIKRGIVQIK